MRLDFVVLWIEDQRDYVEAQEVSLRDQVSEEGFELIVVQAGSVAEARTKLSEDVFRDHVDLILIDYNLPGGENGDEALGRIREQLPYREIVFYSGASAGELRKLAFDQEVEGVYCSHRNDLPSTVVGVFQALIKKVIDVDHSRGIVMGATSDIDYIISDCISLLYERQADEGKAAMVKYAQKRVRKHLETLTDDNAAIESATTMAEILPQHGAFTAIDRLHLLRKFLPAGPEHEESDKSLLSYAEKVMPERNKLAHMRVVVDGFIRRLEGRGGEEITADQMKTLRQTLVQHRMKVDGLSSNLRTPASGS